VPFRLQVITKVIQTINATKILDVGCGNGQFTKVLTIENPLLQLVCLEPNQKYVSEARKNLTGKNVAVIESSFEDFQTKQTWDLCMFNGVLEHMNNPIEALRKASTFAKYTFVIVPNAQSLHRIIGVELGLIPDIKYLAEADLKVGHKRYYDPSLLFSHFRKANLKIVDAGGICLKPLSNQQMLNWSQSTFDLLHELGLKLPFYCAEIWALGAKRNG